MVNVSSVNSIYKPIGKFLDKTAKGPLKNVLESARLNPAQYAARLTVLSFVSKDLINTCVYTYQSLNNERIPKEKRSFVAANDLVLGFFNFFGQIYMQKYVCEKFMTPALESRLTGLFKPKNQPEVYKHSNAPFASDNIAKLAKDVIKGKSEQFKNLKPNEIEEIVKHVTAKAGAGGRRALDIKIGLGVVVSSLATTAFIKRTISPLFATPIAGWLGDRWDKKAAEKEKAELSIVESDVLYNKHKKDEAPKIAK